MESALPDAPEPESWTPERLLSEFDEVLASIRRAARLAVERTSGSEPLELAMGLQHIMSNVALGLALNLHHVDPEHPTLFRYMGPGRKQGGDNADGLYLGAAVDPAYTYRLRGRRGTAAHFSVSTVRSGATPWGGGTGAVIFGRDLEVGPDGEFELVLSATEHEGNWLPLADGDMRVTIRQFFSDWENEEPMEATIERMGAPVAATRWTADHIMGGLSATGHWLENTIEFWQSVMDRCRPHPNRFLGWRQLFGEVVNATPGGDPAVAYWKVPPGKALVLRTTPPECEFWNLEFCNTWWETNDYLYGLTSLNAHHAGREEDGSIVAVVAHDDPGIPNWLDTAGFTEGMMGRRWMHAESTPDIECTLVDHDDLESFLGAVRRITPGEREARIAANRRGVYRRFHWL
jgi:hypothetical protein